MFERPGRSFFEAVGLALQIMVFLGLLMGDFFLITWLETNGYEIWAYVTCAFFFFFFLVWALWR